MVARGHLLLAWFAVTLTAFAPVLVYAHIHVGANGEIVEHCTGDEPDSADTQHHHPNSNEGRVSHCPYCSGFSASTVFATGVLPRLPPAVTPVVSISAASRTCKACLRPHRATARSSFPC